MKKNNVFFKKNKTQDDCTSGQKEEEKNKRVPIKEQANLQELSSEHGANAKGTPKIDSGLACLVFLARFHQVPADFSGVKHEYAPSEGEMSDTDLLRAAISLKLKAKKITRSIQDYKTLTFPCMFWGIDGEWRILGGIKDDKVLIHRPATAKSETLSFEQLTELWSENVILLSTQSIIPESLRSFNLSWFIPSIIKYKRLFMEVLLASFFLQIFGLVTPIFFQVIVDKVLTHRSISTLNVLVIGFFALSFFEVILGGMRTWLFSHTAYRVDVQLGARLFRHLSRLPISYFNSRRVGDTIARVRELENLRRILTSTALTTVVDTCFIVVFLIAMLFYSPFLTGVVVLILPFYAILSLGITPLLRRLLERKFARGADNQAFLVETITDIRTVKAMAVEPQFQRQWEDQLAQYVRSAFQSDNLGNIAVQATAFLDKITTILILWLGAKAVIEGELTVGQLIAFNMMAQRVSAPILRLARVWQDLQQAGVSMKRLGDILNSPVEPSNTSAKMSLPAMHGHIRFENVSFRYRIDGPYILNDISFIVRPGETLGIVGRSGSGKSTITNLLQRFYIPEQGKVLVDGVDLSMIDIVWLRRQMGVVLQESTLFNKTVRDNIALSHPAIEMKYVINAAKLAGAHAFILDLPEGYDTVVGEHGSTLSGGQRQRLAIARALLTNPKILILDEATSALDYESEHIIQQNMAAISKNRTVVIIAHRLSTIMNCDRIIVVDRGQLIESGTHDSLIKKDGYYHNLWSYQTKNIGSNHE